MNLFGSPFQEFLQATARCEHSDLASVREDSCLAIDGRLAVSVSVCDRATNTQAGASIFLSAKTFRRLEHGPTKRRFMLVSRALRRRLCRAMVIPTSKMSLEARVLAGTAPVAVFGRPMPIPPAPPPPPPARTNDEGVKR